MRCTLRQAIAGDRDARIAWWQDFPPRQRAFWKELLFAPGQGWLRWKDDLVSARYDDLEPWEDMQVTPPIRRFFSYLREWIQVPYLMLIGPKYETTGERDRFSWAEACPSWKNYVYLRDPDRRRNLWQIP
jgi:hypothetical protein